MRRLARPSVVYTAAIIAGGIALMSALEAWGRLQYLEASSTIAWIASDGLLSVALPALAIVAVSTTRWLQRGVVLHDRQAEPRDLDAFSELLDADESLPLSWLRSSTRARQSRRQLDRRRQQSAAS